MDGWKIPFLHLSDTQRHDKMIPTNVMVSILASEKWTSQPSTVGLNGKVIWFQKVMRHVSASSLNWHAVGLGLDSRRRLSKAPPKMNCGGQCARILEFPKKKTDTHRKIHTWSLHGPQQIGGHCPKAIFGSWRLQVVSENLLCGS